MLKAILLGFVIGFAAVGLVQAGGMGAGRTPSDLVSLSSRAPGGARVWTDLVRACRARPAYPGLA